MVSVWTLSQSVNRWKSLNWCKTKEEEPWFTYLTCSKVISLLTDLLVGSSTKSPTKTDLGVSVEPSSGDVEIGLHTGSEVDPPVPGSNASTMSTVSSCTERDSNDSSELGVDEQSLREYELVRCVIFSTRDNINVVHEVFRQVCQRHTSLQFSSVSSVVLREYTVWARWRFRISPPRFLAKCRMSRLNQASFVSLYFVLFAFV